MHAANAASPAPPPDCLLLPLCQHRQHEEERVTHTQERHEEQRRWGGRIDEGWERGGSSERKNKNKKNEGLRKGEGMQRGELVRGTRKGRKDRILHGGRAGGGREF